MDTDHKVPECVNLNEPEIKLACFIVLGIIFILTIFSHFRYGTPWFSIFGILLALSDLVVSYLLVCSRWGPAQIICIVWMASMGLTCFVNSRGLVLFIRALNRQMWFESRSCLSWLPLWTLSLFDLSVLQILVSNSFGLSCFQQSISTDDEMSLMFRAGMSKVVLENLVKAGLLAWLWTSAQDDLSPTFLAAAGVTLVDLMHGVYLMWCSDVCSEPVLRRRSSSHFEVPTNSSLQQKLAPGEKNVLDSSQRTSQTDGIPRTYTFSSRPSTRSTSSFVPDDFYVVDGEEAQVVGVTDEEVRFRLLTNGRLLSLDAGELAEETGRVRTFSRNSSMASDFKQPYSLRSRPMLSNPESMDQGELSRKYNSTRY